MINNGFKMAFSIGLIIGLLYFLAYSDTHYTRIGMVKQIGSMYSFKDGTGNNWEFYADSIIPANANVKAKFFNNNTTDNIKDDMLIDYEIVGYVDEVNIEF